MIWYEISCYTYWIGLIGLEHMIALEQIPTSMPSLWFSFYKQYFGSPLPQKDLFHVPCCATYSLEIVRYLISTLIFYGLFQWKCRMWVSPQHIYIYLQSSNWKDVIFLVVPTIYVFRWMILRLIKPSILGYPPFPKTPWSFKGLLEDVMNVGLWWTLNTFIHTKRIL